MNHRPVPSSPFGSRVDALAFAAVRPRFYAMTHQPNRSFTLSFLLGLALAYAICAGPALSQIPRDERLTVPRNHIAADSGLWFCNPTLAVQPNGLPGPSSAPRLIKGHMFRPNAGMLGNYYTACFGVEEFHAQHVVRLPNKNGQAYFMVSHSKQNGGYITVLETELGVLDPTTDLLNDTNGGVTGHYIWQDVYSAGSPVGHWNHPGKMDVLGGILVVAAQNWTSSCGASGTGSSADAVLFYDVRDPQSPSYLGKLTEGQLGMSEISGLSLMREPLTDTYLLSVSGSNPRRFFRSDKISVSISDWTLVSVSGPAEQYGSTFNSYELRGSPGSPHFGSIERSMYMVFDGSFGPTSCGGVSDRGGIGRKSWFTTAQPQFNWDHPAVPTHNIINQRHYNTCSTYVTRYGMPVVYTMLNGHDPSWANNEGVLWQTFDIRNFPQDLALATGISNYFWYTQAPPAPQVPHPPQVVTNLNDHGPGSLRRAIGYGGDVSFDPTLNGGTIRLTEGPLTVYLHDVTVDASGLPNGLTITGNRGNLLALPESSVVKITAGHRAYFRNITFADGLGAISVPREGGAITNDGELSLVDCTVRDSVHFDRAAILNRGRLELDRVTVEGNVNVTGPNGAGLVNEGADASFEITNSTFVGNQAPMGHGAGINNTSTPAVNRPSHIYHSTIVGNSALWAAGLSSQTTFGGAGGLGVRESIIAANLSTNLPGGADINVLPTSVIFTSCLIGTNGNSTVPAGPLVGTPGSPLDPGLMPLGDYGGPTQTMKPLWNSPAVDAGAATSSATDPIVDQRGQPRISSAARDIGAVELQLLTQTLPHGCGPMSLQVGGWPSPGGSVTTSVSGQGAGLPFIGVGFAPTSPLCAGCTLGHSWSSAIFGSSRVLSIPANPGFLGLEVRAQGAGFLTPGGCLAPQIALTDTVVLTIN